MTDSITLGKRLKYFRERAGLSQFDIEVKLDMAPGSLSRIESGKTNPKKETIIRIMNTLNLNDREKDYLIGITSFPASEEDILAVTYETRAFFDSPNNLAYLLDDRERVINVSNGFIRMLGLDFNIMEKVKNRNLISVLLDKELGINSHFEPKDYKESIIGAMQRYYSQCGYMIDDGSLIEAIKDINQYDWTRSAWLEITSNEQHAFYPHQERIIKFRIGKVNVPIKYSVIPIMNYPRFEIIEYTPTNNILKLISKLF